jgi:hypothetical protein
LYERCKLCIDRQRYCVEHWGNKFFLTFNLVRELFRRTVYTMNRYNNILERTTVLDILNRMMPDARHGRQRKQ